MIGSYGQIMISEIGVMLDVLAGFSRKTESIEHTYIMEMVLLD